MKVGDYYHNYRTQDIVKIMRTQHSVAFERSLVVYQIVDNLNGKITFHMEDYDFKEDFLMFYRPYPAYNTPLYRAINSGN